jgi:hypothetical protein
VLGRVVQRDNMDAVGVSIGRSKPRKFSTRMLGAAFVSCAAAEFALGLPVAAASPPLYCNKSVNDNEGCPPPTTWMTFRTPNEGRNESGGSIAVQDYTTALGYTSVVEACCGNVAKIPYFGEYYGFPKVWNRSVAFDRIHGRAS